MTNLHAEIEAALAAAGLRPATWQRLSRLCSAENDREVFRIGLAGGPSDRRTVKARRVENEQVACALVALRQMLPETFAAVFFQHGRVLLEQWIVGRTLDSPPSRRHLEEAGALLGEVHARATTGARAPHELRATAGHRLTALKALRQVRSAGRLDRGQAWSLARAMRRLDPGQARHGLVHFDFCGENMVIDEAGRLRVVDNDRVREDALGFDVARAWYRWSLAPAEWACFHAAYQAALPFREPPETLRFWQLVAVIRATALRLRVAPERAEFSLACLRRLAAEHAS